MTEHTQTDPPAELAALLVEPHVPQQAFAWPKDRWIRWFDGHDGVREVLQGLEDSIDRRRGVELIQGLLAREDVAPAFVVAMVWGHGWSGYGPYRSAAVLTASRRPSGRSLDRAVVTRLEESARLAREEGGASAFRYLSNEGRIAGLGSAFFTKWLYFASAADGPNSSSAAPVLDRLVLDWLKSVANVRLRAGRTRDYERFVDLLRLWGEPYGRSAVQVEETIFRLIRDDGTVPLST